MSNSSSKIAVAGGGIAGLTAAITLQKLGFQTRVFESAPEIKALGAGLVLASNAIKALARIGIADKVIPAGKLLDTFNILDQQGGLITRADNKALSARFGMDNFAIHRADLHRILLQEARGIPIETGKKVTGVEQHGDRVLLHFQDGAIYEADYVVAADGIHSAIRQQLLPDSAVRFAGNTCWRAVIRNPGIEFPGTTETWGSAGRFGIVPMANDLIYWFSSVNAVRNDPSMRAMTVMDLAERFRDYHAPIPQILSATKEEQLIWNDIIDLKPISRFAFERILLIGDAAHATTPNLGQGACQALEDVAVLMDIWEKDRSRPPQEVFRQFEKRRIKRTHRIVNRSWMLGKVAQWSNPLAASIRNGLFSMMPASLNERQLAEIYTVDF